MTESLGEKWGFVIAWVLWSQMFPGLIMITSTLGPLIGQVFGQPELSQNHWFAFFWIIVTTWAATLLSFKYDVAKIGGSYGVWIGVYIPAITMIILGFFAFLKTGLNLQSYLGTFAWQKVIPNAHNLKVLTYFSAIMFLFTGIELTSVYIPSLKDSKKNYPRGIFISLMFIIILNVINSLFASNAIEKGTIQLANVAQPIIRYCEILGLPTWIANIFSLCVVIGVVLQMSSWINGPCHTITQAAREGNVPAEWGFYKTNKNDISKNLLWTQITILTIFALLYAFVKNVNAMFITLTNATSVLYMLVYLFLVIAVLKLRYTQPHLERPGRVGKTGNSLLWLVGSVLIISILFVFASIIVSSSPLSLMLVIGIAVILFVVPLLINHYKNPQWLKDVQQYQAKNL